MTTTTDTPSTGTNERQSAAQIAHGVACNYHTHVASLARSKYASPALGGPVHRQEWITKRNGRWNGYPPRKWIDYGYQVSPSGGITLISASGKRVIELPPIPGRIRKRLDDLPGAGLIDGDMLSVPFRGLATKRERWTVISGKWVKTGVSLWVSSAKYWEHGATWAECAEEARVKSALRLAASDPKLSTRIERFSRLVLRLCHGATATIDDAKSLGYCRAGIEAFQRRWGVGDHATLRELVSTGNPLAIKLAVECARKVAARRVIHN